MGKQSLLMVCLVIALTGTTLPAQAYLDPGSGSIMIQVLLGGLAGVAVFAKYYWGQLAGFFIKPKAAPRDESENNN